MCWITTGMRVRVYVHNVNGPLVNESRQHCIYIHRQILTRFLLENSMVVRISAAFVSIPRLFGPVSAVST